MNRSALAQAGSGGKEKILPACSPMNRRGVPGALDISSGFLNVSLGKARSMRYGGGVSGGWEFLIKRSTANFPNNQTPNPQMTVPQTRAQSQLSVPSESRGMPNQR